MRDPHALDVAIYVAVSKDHLVLIVEYNAMVGGTQSSRTRPHSGFATRATRRPMLESSPSPALRARRGIEAHTHTQAPPQRGIHVEVLSKLALIKLSIALQYRNSKLEW